MGHRLSKIYTRTGDKGTTTLGSGERVQKDSVRIEAVGTVDEVNCFVGLLLANNIPKEIRECLTRIQHELFDLGGELSIPRHQIITAEHVLRLENELDRFNTDLPHLREFILPSGGRAVSTCHIARAVCRRAERRLVSLSQIEDVFPESLAYLNRLSDLLFVIARVLARADGKREVMWRSERNK